MLTAFGLLSIVDSKAPPIAITGGGNVSGDPSRAVTWDMSTKKLKFGLDGLYTPLYWLGFGGRFDMVMPDLDSAYSRTPGNPGGSSLNFAVLTAKAIIRTAFVTHESVMLSTSITCLATTPLRPIPINGCPRRTPTSRPSSPRCGGRSTVMKKLLALSISARAGRRRLLRV